MNITVHTNIPMHIAVDRDTVSGSREELEVVVKRKKEPLSITLYNDTFSKTINVNSRNSLAFLLNAYPGYTFLYGFLVDLNNPKRYTYPRHIYIDLNEKRFDYRTKISHFDFKRVNFSKKDSMKIFRNQIKFYPLKTVSDIRGVYLSYERFYGLANSTEFTAAYVFDPFAGPNLGTWSKMYGHAFGIEQKRFLSVTPHGLNFASMELSYRNCQFEMIYAFKIDKPKDSLEKAHYHEDTIMIKHKTFNIAFKCGSQIYFDRFVAELNIGLGLRYKDVAHLNKLHPNDVMAFPIDFSFTSLTIAPGRYFTAYIPVQLKIGYRF